MVLLAEWLSIGLYKNNSPGTAEVSWVFRKQNFKEKKWEGLVNKMIDKEGGA